MMRISDIMEKEIINVKNGKKLGFITDIDLDVENGKVSSFSITGSSGNFFYRGAEIDTVYWKDILRIGCDTIIVSIGSNLDVYKRQVIGSAGAISLAEITALGKPSIIIPKAYTAENHQEYNAKSIEAQGAGIAILEKDLTPQSLNDAVFKLLGDKEMCIRDSSLSCNLFLYIY